MLWRGSKLYERPSRSGSGALLYNNGGFENLSNIYFAPGWRQGANAAPYGFFYVDFFSISSSYGANEDSSNDISYVHLSTNIQNVVGGLNVNFGNSVPPSGLLNG